MLRPLHHLKHVKTGVEDVGMQVRRRGAAIDWRGVEVDLVERLIPSDNHEHCHHPRGQSALEGEGKQYSNSIGCRGLGSESSQFSEYERGSLKSVGYE